jgi:MFS family permease
MSMDAAQWRRCLWLSVSEGALATAMATLLSGVFITGFALTLGASRATIGLLAALPQLANVAQLIGAKFLDSGVDRKRFCVRMLAASRLSWLALLLIPFFGALNKSWILSFLIAIVAISSTLSSIGGVAWFSWIRDLVPPARQLSFLGVRNQTDSALALALSIAAAVFIDWWRLTYESPIGGFACVFFVALGCGFIGIPILNRMEHRAPTPRRAAIEPTKAHSPLGERNFQNLVSFYVLWNLSTNLASPFFVVFLFEKAHLPFWHIVILQTLASLIGLFANRYWVRLGNRIGTKPVVFLATLGDAFYPLCWVFLSPDATSLLPLLFLFGVFNAPLAVGAPALVMKIVPEEKSNSYLATFNAIIGLVVGFAAVGGGLLIDGVNHLGALGENSLLGLKLVFFLSAIGRLGSLLLLGRVIETEPRGVDDASDILGLPSQIGGASVGQKVGVPLPTA